MGDKIKILVVDDNVGMIGKTLLAQTIKNLDVEVVELKTINIEKIKKDFEIDSIPIIELQELKTGKEKRRDRRAKERRSANK